MRVSSDVLRDQATRALRMWPFVLEVERAHNLPSMLLLAVGSAETNLNPAFTHGSTGDGGHGHGVWQLDDRSHTIPPGFDLDAQRQADAAASQLAALLTAERGDVVRACNRYNSGQPGDKGATHGTGSNAWVYGREVAARRLWLVANIAAPSTEDDMDRTAIPSWLTRQTTGRVGFYRLADNNGDVIVFGYNGAPLLRVDGSTFAVPYMKLPALASPPVGIEETGDGAVVVVCGDGGCIDVAHKP